jgi:hypothetical protein
MIHLAVAEFDLAPINAEGADLLLRYPKEEEDGS